MPNEPAEDRSVRGNTIKPAKVEPDKPIETQYQANRFTVSTFAETVESGTTYTFTTGIDNNNVVSVVPINPVNENITSGSGGVIEYKLEYDSQFQLEIFVRNTDSSENHTVEFNVLRL